ncbi:hypothetical protein RQP46_000613 [Phenoliferia psychrophenolica]
MPSLFSSSPSPSLKVEIAQSSVYLHPSPDPSIPAEDQLLRGFVVLTLPKPRRVSDVVVSLQGYCTYQGGPGWPYERSAAALSKEVSLSLGEECLDAGDHRLDFSFIIPANTAEYQTSNYGRIHHHIHARADLPGSLATRLSLKSTAVPVHFIANPTPVLGGVPEPYTALLTTYHEELGPVRVTVSAPHLTVASLISYEFSLLSPPAGLVITGLKGFLTQQFEIQYISTKVARPPPTHNVLCTVDQSTGTLEDHNSKKAQLGYKGVAWDRFDSFPDLPEGVALAREDRLKEVAEGSEWTYQKLSRMPHDDNVRPSTLEHTNTPIRVAHLIGAEVTFRFNGEPEKTLQLTRKVHIVSCCCMLDHLRLPSYSKDLNLKLEGRDNSCDSCICSSSFQELVEKDEFGPFVPMEEGDGSGVAVAGREAALRKTPAVGAATGYAATRSARVDFE